MSGAAVAFIAGSLGVASPVVAHGAEAAKAKPRPVIVEQPTVSPNRYFSPNGDGLMDRASVPFRLRGKARVSVVIRPMSSESLTSPQTGVASKEVVRRLKVGVRKAGDRTWSWNGRDDRGTVVPDGAYEITVKAKPFAKKRSAGAISLVVDSHTTFQVPDDMGPVISLSRRSLYPDTTAVKDQISIVGNELPGGRWDPEGSVPRLSIKDAAGNVVRQVTYPALLLWDGTNSAGARVPNGTYTVQADWSDNHGNYLSRAATVIVAAGSLVRHDWSKTYDDPFDALVQNGVRCSWDCDQHAVARASTRYPTGMSFGRTAQASFEAVTPFAQLDPVLDQVRLTTTGGPTTPGDATSTAYYYPTNGTASPVAAGDGTSVSPWYAARPSDRFGWTFGSTLGGYDVDSFTVDVVHWAPPAS